MKFFKTYESFKSLESMTYGICTFDGYMEKDGISLIVLTLNLKEKASWSKTMKYLDKYIQPIIDFISEYNIDAKAFKSNLSNYLHSNASIVDNTIKVVIVNIKKEYLPTLILGYDKSANFYLSESRTAAKFFFKDFRGTFHRGLYSPDMLLTYIVQKYSIFRELVSLSNVYMNDSILRMYTKTTVNKLSGEKFFSEIVEEDPTYFNIIKKVYENALVYENIKRLNMNVNFIDILNPGTKRAIKGGLI